MIDIAEAFVLPERWERTYPRIVKARPKRYPEKKGKNAHQLLTTGINIQSWFAQQRDALVSIFNFVKTVE